MTEASKADIMATEMNDGGTPVAGEAESQTNLLTGQFLSVTVRLNHYYLSILTMAIPMSVLSIRQNMSWGMRLAWTIQMRSLSCNLQVPFMVSRKRMFQDSKNI